MSDLTVKEVTEILKVGRSTVSLWCRNGTLKGAYQEETPFGVVWYIPASALEGFTLPERGRPPKKTSKKSKR